MKLKIRLGIEALLVVATIVVAIYNFSIGRNITYFASIVAVLGAVAIVIKDIYNVKKK